MLGNVVTMRPISVRVGALEKLANHRIVSEGAENRRVGECQQSGLRIGGEEERRPRKQKADGDKIG